MKIKGISKHEELLYFFELIIIDMSTNGTSLRNSIKGRMSPNTFYDLIDNDDEKMKQYVRACDMRADYMADEIIDIADDTSEDVSIKMLPDGTATETENREFINRSKVRIDARKWLMTKQNPKKYGDKSLMELTGKDGKDLVEPTQINFIVHKDGN